MAVGKELTREDGRQLANDVADFLRLVYQEETGFLRQVELTIL